MPRAAVPWFWAGPVRPDDRLRPLDLRATFSPRPTHRVPIVDLARQAAAEARSHAGAARAQLLTVLGQQASSCRRR